MTIAPPQKSTNVRISRAPLPTRAAFGLLERAAPAAGAAWAERLWFTLPPRRPAPDPPPGSIPFDLDLGCHRVRGRSWGDGPAVYLLHGWAGHSGQFAAFVPALLDRGLRPVVLDAPSHGTSDPGRYGPRSSAVPEFAEALVAAVSAHGPARGIVAHSLGATAAAVALCDGLRAERLALLAPLASPLTYSRQLTAVLGFGRRTHARLVARVERRVGAPMHHFDVPAIGAAVAMPKTLVVHDRGDAATPVSDGVAIAKAWPGSRLHLTSGLGHNRLLRDPGVVAEVVGFLSG